jgi:hypothetical protein
MKKAARRAAFPYFTDALISAAAAGLELGLGVEAAALRSLRGGLGRGGAGGEDERHESREGDVAHRFYLLNIPNFEGCLRRMS